MIRKVTSTGVITNPIKLFNLLDAGTKSLTTDKQMSNLSVIQDIAESMTGIRPSDVTFVTVPYVYNADGSTVSWDQAKADRMFKAIINDQPWPEPATVPAGQTALTVPPSDISVLVVNGTPQDGFGNIVATDLQQQGYTVAGVRGAKTNSPTTSVSYGAADAEAARTLSYASGATDSTVTERADGVLVLKVGDDYSGIKPVVTKKKKDPLDTSAPKTADTSICVS